MGQGTSRLNWVCTCEDGKFNLSATYEEQKQSPTAAAENQETQKSKTPKVQPIDKCQKTSTSKDTLLPIMDVECSMDEPNRNTKLRRTFSSCDLVYTRPATDPRRPQGSQGGRNSGVTNKDSQQYRSHEVLSSAGSSSTNTESSGLSQSNSENSLISSKSVDSKLHRVFGTSNVYKTKREQADKVNGQKPNINMTSNQHPSLERKSSVNSTTSTGSTERKSSIGDISSLSELLKKKKKDARRAEIVAAVTKRLYSARKKVEMIPEPVEVVPEQEDNPEEDDAEPDELKLCSRARARLQELSKRALHAHRGKIRRYSDVEAQTDFDSHVLRVKEVAVSTEELYHGPQLYFTENKKLLFTSFGYPSLRQHSSCSPLSIGNYNSHQSEDCFSDDSLDSTHEMEAIEEEKPSLWNVISISSGKQFKINEEDNGCDQIFTDRSTQTQVSNNEEETEVNLDNGKVVEPEQFHIFTSDMGSPREKDLCEYDHTSQSIEVTQCSELSSCSHNNLQQEADSCRCKVESEDTGISITSEGTTLHQIDRHLYTITENSEHSDCNDMTSGDYDNSYPASPIMSQKTVPVIEYFEDYPSVTLSSSDTCSCRTVRAFCRSCQVHVCELCRTLSSGSTTYPHSYEECPMLRKYNHDLQQGKDKMSQTTAELYVHSTMENCYKLKKNTNEMKVDIGSSTEIRKCPQDTATAHGSNLRICKYCNKPITCLDSTDDTKIASSQKTRTEGTQYTLSHLPADVGTQTSNAQQLPNMTILCSTLFGTHPQFLQMSNSTLQFEDCIAILFSGHSPQPIIMKPIHWNNIEPSDTVGVQTDENREHRPADMNECNVEPQFCQEMQDRGIQSKKSHSQKRAKIECSSLYQSACSQSTSQQITDMIITPASSNQQLHMRNQHSVKTSNSNSSDEEDNFPDEEDTPSLPRTTVTPMQGTEAAGYQHWAEIKNLILGTDRNVFPRNVTIEEETCSLQQSRNIKKKSVSWSDLSGCGALHTEIVFASDHNLFDSSQAPPSKISKDSLLDVIATEPQRPSHRSRQMTLSWQEDLRRHDRKLHRSVSLVDMKELGNKQLEGKLRLSAFLREASALVNSLSQATRLLEKGRQLNIGTSIPYTEQEENLHTVRNELWRTADSTPNQSTFVETEISDNDIRFLPLSITSSEYFSNKTRNRKNVITQYRNLLSTSKDCNMNTQMHLDKIHCDKSKSNWFCDECCCKHEDHHISSLPDCSSFSKNHWHHYYSTSTCPIHQSSPRLNDLDYSELHGRTFQFYPLPCTLGSPRAYRQHLVAIRRQIIRASLPFTNLK